VPPFNYVANVTVQGRDSTGPCRGDSRGTRESHAHPSYSERQTWASVAAAYDTYTSPLRPCHDDLKTIERAAHDWSSAHPGRAMRTLLLGATPDIAKLNWPLHLKLVAMDSSTAVIKAIWPGDVRGHRWATCGNWLSLPLRAGSCDMVVGDGALTASRYPDEWRAMAATLRDVLSDSGVLALRCFARMEHPETPDRVIQDLLGGKVGNINHFKFRLFIALQRSTDEGCPVRDAYRFLRSRVSDEALRSIPGWSEAAINGFELWRHADTVYTFPTLSEVRSVLGEFLRERKVWFPSYTLGDNCPTLLWTRS